ncbi:MAG: hypothetical protein GDA49_04715 [Rhodospirillales bacterium]|nr:hypothetical protein [Rhodospirillales bacterium]
MRLKTLLALMAAVLLVSLTGAPAVAQFADDSQGLFETPGHSPKDDEDLVLFEFSTDDTDDQANENAGAQSVEEICCSLPSEERARQGICIDVELSCE